MAEIITALVSEVYYYPYESLDLKQDSSLDEGFRCVYPLGRIRGYFVEATLKRYPGAIGSQDSGSTK